MKKTLYFFIFMMVQFAVSGQRSEIELSEGWNFYADKHNEGERQNWSVNGLPAAKVAVTVPHTWNVMPGLEKYWGKGWYEKMLDISADLKGKTVRLQFDAVYHDATIWINGKKAGGHYGAGYTRFYIDITDFVKPGKLNRLVILTDNSASRSSLPFMKSFDWAHDGGIYRNVKLIITEPQYIRKVDVIATPDSANNTKGILNLKIFAPASVVNGKSTMISAEIQEENQGTSNIIFSGLLQLKQNEFLETVLNLDSVKPWHFDRPNLYTIKLTLYNKGKVVDTFTTTFGFRTIAIEGDRFVLNGEKVRLAGTEWMPGSSLKNGMAETKEELEANLKLLKGTNCIYTRFHWPQDEFVLDWCDRNGILVQEEIPYWGGGTEMNDTTFALGEKFLDEMMAAHFNHPCIISWGIGNELQAHNPVFLNALTLLRDKAKAMDPSRLVTYVSNSVSWSKEDNPAMLPDATSVGDVLMWNEYTPTWYEQLPENTLPALEKIHREYPGKPLVISEFGLCEPVFPGGDTRRIADVSFQMPLYGSLPFIAGSIYFCLNDYRTHMGEDFTFSYPQRVHGIVDINLVPKPSYEVVKVLCSPLVLKHLDKEPGKWTVELMAREGLPAYTVEGYTITGGNESVIIPTLKPGEKKKFDVSVPSGCKELKVMRPTGFEVMTLK